ncbi:MAG: TonB-dependent receptor [Sulfurimonas sp.]|jgi:iron complex outermembrane receptor protein|nr:TonB-dependent receptor [Sulfurimonas sp.]
MQKNIKLSLILVACLSSLHADDAKKVVLEPLSITSTAIKTDELRSTDAVEIYTQEDIEKAHVQNMYEFLNSQTSIVATPSYGNPFNQKLDMRGFGNDGYQNIVVTINGRKMNNVDMVPAMLSSISPSSVSRIEIIKSSGIVVGGDGANAGVINIITKQSNDKEISFYMGTYGVADASFYMGHQGEKLSISASGEAQKSSGIRDIDTAGNKDENKFSTGSFNLSYLATDALELSFGASFARTDVIYGGSLTKDEYEDNPMQKSSGGASHQQYDNDVLNAGVKYYINDNLSINANINQEKKKSNFVTWSSVSNYDYKSLSASIDYATDSLSVKVGIDGFDGDRIGSSATTSKNNKAAYIMTNYKLDKSSFKAGYRFENVAYVYDNATTNLKQDNNLYGAELGYNYLINKQSSIFTNYSHSFQAPDIDRFFSSGVFNGFIDPAKVDTFSLGYNNISKNNKFKISAYYATLKNEIYYYKDPAGISSAKNTNIDKSYKYGIDLYDKYIISPEFSLALNYNYVQAIIDKEKEGSDDYSGNKLPGVSDHNAKATLGYTPNKFSTIALTQIYRSEAYAANDFNNNLSQKQGAYMTTDISATYAKKTWEVFAKINNLFNQKNGLWIKDDAIYPVNFTTTAIAGFKLKY